MKVSWFFIYMSAAVLAFALCWVFFGGPYIEGVFVAGLSMLFTSSMILCFLEQDKGYTEVGKNE